MGKEAKGQRWIDKVDESELSKSYAEIKKDINSSRDKKFDFEQLDIIFELAKKDRDLFPGFKMGRDPSAKKYMNHWVSCYCKDIENPASDRKANPKSSCSDPVVKAMVQQVKQVEDKIIDAQEKTHIIFMSAENVLGNLLEEYIPEDLETLIKELHSTIPQLSYITVDDIKSYRFPRIYDSLKEAAQKAYKEHEEEIIGFYNSISEQYDPSFVKQELFTPDNIMRSLERDILLRVVDNQWIDHLHNIDMLKDGIGLRAYGQKDPLIEYKKEAYDLFNKMMYEIQGETVKHLFRTKFGVQIVHQEPVETSLSKAAEEFDSSEDKEEIEVKPIRKGEKIGRTDPCPCGSGKKYKNCCMNKVDA